MLLLGWGLASEARISYLQSQIFSRFGQKMSVTVQPGPSDTIVSEIGALRRAARL